MHFIYLHLQVDTRGYVFQPCIAIVQHEVDTLTLSYDMPEIHWKYVSCGCRSTAQLQISASLPYWYVHSVCVSPLQKKENYRHDSASSSCDNLDTTIQLRLPTAIKHPSSHHHVSKCQKFSAGSYLHLTAVTILFYTDSEAN